MPSRRPAAAVALAVTLLLAGCLAGGGADLEAEWVSDTRRNVTGNHHAVAVGEIDDRGFVFAPISGEDRSPHCALAALHAGNGTTAWSAAIPPEECIIHSVADPALADYDADGTREVLAATTQRAVVAHDPLTGEVEWRHDLTAYGYTQVVVADLAPAAGPEVVVADVQGGLFVVDPGNGAVWNRSLGGHVWAQPAVTDLDADGAPELVVADGRGVVAAFERDGTTAWRLTDALDSAVTWTTTGQADADPAVEVVVATARGDVIAVDGRTGAVAWSRNFGSFAAVRALGDGDGDGTPEVYAAALDGRLRSLDGPTGSVEWTTTLTNGSVQMAPPPGMADLDGDGDPELVAATNDGLVAVVDPATGDVLTTYRRSDPAGDGVPVYTHPTLADADGDGTPEVYVIYGDGRVARLAYSGG